LNCFIDVIDPEIVVTQVVGEEQQNVGLGRNTRGWGRGCGVIRIVACGKKPHAAEQSKPYNSKCAFVSEMH
jgi:hypothetical protein